jgi:hypothetical protein
MICTKIGRGMPQNRTGNRKPSATLATRRVTLDLSQEDYRKLVELAARDGVSRREVLQKALRLAYILFQVDSNEEIILRNGDEEIRLLIT